MLGWVQRVLPQPPGTPQKTEQAAGPQPETESKPEAKPLPEPEPQPEQEPEPEPAPEEAVPEVQALATKAYRSHLNPQPPQEPMEGEGEVEAGPSLQETQEVDPPQSTSQPQAAVAKVNRPSSWMLSWFWKGMEKVVPQPVCNSSGGQNLTAGEGGPDQQGGAQIPEPCGTGNPGSADGSDKASRTQDTEHSLWLLRWLEQNLEKVLPQPPRPSQAWKVEPESAVLDPDPPGTPMEPEPTENPSQPNPGPLEPEEEPPAEPQPGFQASSLPPPGDPVRLIEWLLHRLEMALPQPVLHGKAAEQELDCPGTCDVQTRATAAGGL